MPFTTLIDTTLLADHLTDPTWVVVDCRFRLEDTTWGEQEYEAAHVPGAAYVHLDRDLSGAKTGHNGRHPLPAVEAFGRLAARLRIQPGVQVVAYDQDNGMFASRLWWLLRWIGHDDVAVLDGGFAKWLREGRPIETSNTGNAETAERTSGLARRPHPEVGRTPRTDVLVGAEGVAAHMDDAAWKLLDARAPERYRGESEPLDRVPGHIPGAVNRFFKLNLREDGTFLPREELRASLLTALDDTPPGQVVCYCGSGVTACHNLLALEHAGLTGAKLYPGSWSEWSSDPERPVERT